MSRREELRQSRYRHTSMRIFARFGVEIQWPDYERLCEHILAGHFPLRKVKKVNGSHIYEAKVRGKLMGLVWNPDERLIATVVELKTKPRAEAEAR